MSIQNFLSIEQLTDRYLNPNGKTQVPAGQPEFSFKDVLKQKETQRQQAETELKFSKHASGRLSERGINLSDSQIERLEDGVRRAQEKGIRDSLVIVDDLAFIVNVPNNTVVTAMDSTRTDDNVFTNINGAVIM
ncbi:MAG: flagellar protein [Lachnospiraceae bacterium]|nr:flagellar protein [Lachnospiraceae bacterium]MBQ8118353.1 flagellar protein [Lachnospiraceae bacterium]